MGKTPPLLRLTATLSTLVFCALLQSVGEARPKINTNQSRRILTQSEQTPPPKLFLDLGANLSGADYHVNSKMARGWIASTICPRSWPDKRRMTVKAWSKILKKKRGCAALVRSYKTSIIRDKKYRGDTVAQDLHLWIYKTPSAARRAVANMDDMTLGKRPYRTWRLGESVLVLEWRWRFKRFGKELQKYVNAQLNGQGWKTK
jgi:hypothetical protein